MNEKKDTLYLECYSGISGDMVTAALLDLGADEVVLRKALASLPLDGFSINISRVKKARLDACDFDVVLDAEHENHDHDTAYLYGGVEECGHTHDVHEHNHDEHDHHHDEDGHEHRHGHCCHDHAAEHCHDHEHDHAHRGLAEVLDILNKADLTDRARATAVRIFTILGQAEAKAHGATLETVHFHEVGAVDSIVDITAAAVCLDNLGIEDVIVPVLYEGTGSIRCAHGVLPIPVPAVVNIAAAEHLNLHITDAKGEYVTPTGAAIAAAVRTSRIHRFQNWSRRRKAGAGTARPGAGDAHPPRRQRVCRAGRHLQAGIQHRRHHRRSAGLRDGAAAGRGCTGRAVQPGLHEKEPSCVPFDRALPGGGHYRTGRNHFCGDHHHRHPPRADGAQHLEAPYLHHSHLTG